MSLAWLITAEAEILGLQLRIPTLQEKTVAENHFIIEAIDDDARSGPARDQIERGWRNLNWLTANWATLLPQARGRFVAVAGQESFLADSAAAAWAWARALIQTMMEPLCNTSDKIKDQGFMCIAGKWLKCDDGVTRPVMLIRVQAQDGSAVDETFLIDSGADRTVLSAAILECFAGQTTPAPPGMSLAGVGGRQNYVQVQSVLEMVREDGGVASIRGDFAAFTDPTATDLSVLGRDVLNHFDVILSRARDEVLLLAGFPSLPSSGFLIGRNSGSGRQ